MHTHDDFPQTSTGSIWRDRLVIAGAAIVIGLSLSTTAPADETSRETKRSADVKHDEAVGQAKADYKAARAKCNDLGGNPKEVCIKEAKAAEKRDRKSTRLNSSHGGISRMPSSA